MIPDVDFYRDPGRLTEVDPTQVWLAAELGDDPVAICQAVQRLVVEPGAAIAAGVAEGRLAERNIRPAHALIDVLTTLARSPLHEPRPPQLRVVGTCRHFAVLSCALLRLRGIPARARCGFATYFVAGKSVDHWIVEYWRASDSRWVRVDAEVVGTNLVADPADLAVDEFLTGGEAWLRHRAESIDPDLFGVAGDDYAWGIGEIRGNAIRDLASLCKVEMLPWDEWGRMTDSYEGKTGAEYDKLMDLVAAACSSNDLATIRAVYATEDLAVPSSMIV
jgi:hypothetical protein